MRINALFSFALLAGLASIVWPAYSQDGGGTNTRGDIVSGWDLTVSTVDLSATTLLPNGDLTVTATATNLGDQSSPAGTRIRVFRSPDPIIDTTDVIIDDDTLEDPVPPGADFTQSANVKVPGASGAGIWYIGVCIITQAGETDVTNNCSDGTEIEVSGSATPPVDPPVSTDGWDLTVTSVTLSALQLEPNGDLVVTATASNIGDQASPSQVRIRVFRSPDPIIDTTDIIIDDDTLEDPILPGGNFTQSANVKVPGAGGAGIWYIGVCIITQAGETDATNNCSAGTEILVTGTPPDGGGGGGGTGGDGWDLTISDVTLSQLTLPPNGDLVVTATAENIGIQSSPAQVRIRVFRSPDATIDTSDIIIDDDTLEDPIPPGASFTQSANVKVPGAGGAGTWYIGVCIITQAGEADATNNCSPGTEILVDVNAPPGGGGGSGGPGWDLTVSDVTLSETTLAPNDDLIVTATAENIGIAASPAQVRIRVFRSADATIDPSDIIIDDDTLENPILPGGNFTQSANVKVPGAGGAGTWYIGVCIITQTGEADATNNCSEGTEILVTGGTTPPPGGGGGGDGWDLTITDVTLSALTLPPNGDLVVTATTTNIGTQSSPAQVRIRVFRSADATIDPSDIIIDDDTLEDPLLPGLNFTQSANVKVPGASGAGPWFIGVCIITQAGETDATNNCSPGTEILVNGGGGSIPPIEPGSIGGWDLTVPAVSLSATELAPNADLIVTTTAENIGDQASPAQVRIRVFRSIDATIDLTDTIVDDDTLEDPILPGEDFIQSASVKVPGASGAGIYWIGACTLTAPGEVDAGNNCSTGTMIFVGVTNTLFNNQFEAQP